MGQTKLQKIQQSLITLTQNSQIEQQQAQNFIKDYITSGEQINDINNYIENQSIDLFLKYFIKYTYKDKGCGHKEYCQGNFSNVGYGKIIEQNGDNKAQTKLAGKIVQSWCNQIWGKVKSLLKILREFYLQNSFNIVGLRQKIKDILITYLEIQSYRYYFFKENVMKQTNSKILYMYNTLHQNQIYKYAYNYINYKKTSIQSSLQTTHTINQISQQPQKKSDLVKIIGQLYSNVKHHCFEFYDKSNQILHIFLIELNQNKWKYDKCVQQKIIKRILQKIVVVLIQNMKDVYNSETVVQNLNYKNYFTKLILNFIEQFVQLETLRVNYVLKQMNLSQKQKESCGIQKIIFIKQTILTKIRQWRSFVDETEEVLYFSFDHVKQLEFLYSYKKDSQEFHKKIEQIRDLEDFLKYYFPQNKKIAKRILRAFDKRSKNQQILLQNGITVNITKSQTCQSADNISFKFQVKDNLQQDQQSQFSQQKQNSKKLINKIKNQYPDVIQASWFKLYIKQQSQNAKEKQSQLHKRHRNIPLSKLNRQFKISKFKNLFSIEQLRQDINIQNQKLNLLEFDSKKLDIFTIKVFSKLSYFRDLSHEKDQFPNFLRQIHGDYQKNNNKFHNFSHATTVMHTAYLFCNMRKNQQILSEMEKFTIVFSALCHDVGHTGFTNLFQIARQSEIAILYNNKSPLQNYHASRTFQILRKTSNNFLASMPKNQFIYFRKLVISSILYTDIKEHFNLIKKFEIKKNNIQSQDISLLAGMIVHASDFGGSIKQFGLSKTWSLLVNQQFTKQYNEQTRLGLPQTPFMKDLDKMSVLAKNQSGFLKVIVQPLYKQLSSFYQNNLLKLMLNNIQKNMKQWQKLLPKQQNLKQGNNKSNSTTNAKNNSSIIVNK